MPDKNVNNVSTTRSAYVHDSGHTVITSKNASYERIKTIDIFALDKSSLSKRKLLPINDEHIRWPRNYGS